MTCLNSDCLNFQNDTLLQISTWVISSPFIHDMVKFVVQNKPYLPNQQCFQQKKINNADLLWEREREYDPQWMDLTQVLTYTSEIWNRRFLDCFQLFDNEVLDIWTCHVIDLRHFVCVLDIQVWESVPYFGGFRRIFPSRLKSIFQLANNHQINK